MEFQCERGIGGSPPQRLCGVCNPLLPCHPVQVVKALIEENARLEGIISVIDPQEPMVAIPIATFEALSAELEALRR